MIPSSFSSLYWYWATQLLICTHTIKRKTYKLNKTFSLFKVNAGEIGDSTPTPFHSQSLSLSLHHTYDSRFAMQCEILFSLSSSTDWFILHRLCSLFSLATFGGRLYYTRSYITLTWDYLSVCKHSYMSFEIKYKRKTVVQRAITITARINTVQYDVRMKPNVWDREWIEGCWTFTKYISMLFSPYITRSTSSTKVSDRQNHLLFFICLFARQLALSATKMCFQKQLTAYRK